MDGDGYLVIGVIFKWLSQEDRFYPKTTERSRHAILSVTECYLQGISTRDVETRFEYFCIESLCSSQESKANIMLDERFRAWRNRELGDYSYPVLDAHYQIMCISGVVRNVAVLYAIGIDWQSTRSVLGLSVLLLA